jgi:hypothetical protein
VTQHCVIVSVHGNLAGGDVMSARAAEEMTRI